jgi:hypothetical protein
MKHGIGIGIPVTVAGAQKLVLAKHEASRITPPGRITWAVVHREIVCSGREYEQTWSCRLLQ